MTGFPSFPGHSAATQPGPPVDVPYRAARRVISEVHLPYDSRSDLITRLTAVRDAISKARIQQSYDSGEGMSMRGSLRTLLEEEREILRRIEMLDAYSRGGTANKVKFGRPT